MNKLQKIRQTLKQREDYAKKLEIHQAQQQKEIQKQIEEKLDEEIKIKTIQSEIERKHFEKQKTYDENTIIVNTRQLDLHYGENSNGLRELETDLNFLREVSTVKKRREGELDYIKKEHNYRYFHFCIDRNFDKSTTISAFHYTGDFKLLFKESVQKSLSSEKIREKIERLKEVIEKRFKSQINSFKDYVYIPAVVTTNDKYLKVKPFTLEYREYLEMQKFHNYLAEDKIILDSDNKELFPFDFNELNSFQRCCLLLDFEAEKHIESEKYHGIIEYILPKVRKVR